MNALQKDTLKNFINQLSKSGARCDWQVMQNGMTIERWSGCGKGLILQIFPKGGFTYYFESVETSMNKCLPEIDKYFNPTRT